jgi:formamidopyrimidine-DNA glycosylase
MKPGRTFVVDEFGGRVLYHKAGDPPPKKYHLLVRFEDGSFLTIAIQGWGFLALLTDSGIREHARKLGRDKAVSPLAKAFTLECFMALFDHYRAKDKDSIKLFFTNGQSVAGIGNGCLQDVLFRAKIDPRRKVGQISAKEKKALHRALRDTLEPAISQNGRECERDLYGNPGKYKPVMDRNTKGTPCPACKTPIERIQYLGGSCYLCPTCQT